MPKFDDDAILQQLKRIADALERQWPPLPDRADLAQSEAYVWHSDIRELMPIYSVNRLALGLLRGVDEQRDLLIANTTAFAKKLPANRVPSNASFGFDKCLTIKNCEGGIPEGE